MSTASNAVLDSDTASQQPPIDPIPLRDLVANVVVALGALQLRLSELAVGIDGEPFAEALRAIQRLGA